MGERIRPSVQEESPAVSDMQPEGILLCPRLLQEGQRAAVVHVPYDTAVGEDGLTGEGRARAVLAEPGGIDDEAGVRMTGQ